MLIKCQTNTQKFQENTFLTKASACHQSIEEFGIAYCVLLLLNSVLRLYQTTYFLFPTVGNILIYCVFILLLLPCYLWAYSISSYSTSLMAHRKTLDISGYKVQAPC